MCLEGFSLQSPEDVGPEAVFLGCEIGSAAPVPGVSVGVPYLPAVKQVPFAAPMVENATKRGTTQEAG